MKNEPRVGPGDDPQDAPSEDVGVDDRGGSVSNLHPTTFQQYPMFCFSKVLTGC